MKTKHENRPTKFNPNDSDYVSRNKQNISSGGTGQNYSADAESKESNLNESKSPADDSTAINSGTTNKIDETHS